MSVTREALYRTLQKASNGMRVYVGTSGRPYLVSKDGKAYPLEYDIDDGTMKFSPDEYELTTGQSDELSDYISFARGKRRAKVMHISGA